MPILIGTMKLYTVPEVAELLQLEERTVRGLLASGKLKGKKFGGRWHVSEEWLQEIFSEPDNTSKEEA